MQIGMILSALQSLDCPQSSMHAHRLYAPATPKSLQPCQREGRQHVELDRLVPMMGEIERKDLMNQVLYVHICVGYVRLCFFCLLVVNPGGVVLLSLSRYH